MNQREWLATTSRYFEKHPAFACTLAALWVLLLGGVIFIWNLGNVGLVDETEPLFAEAARQMLVRNDWITPYFNGETRFDKPPLIYWLMALAYKLVGINEWGARLPSALAAIAVMGMLFYVVYRYSDVTARPIMSWFTAAIATAGYALSLLTIVWGRTGVSDMLLTGCVSLALLCFFCGYASENQGTESRDHGAEAAARLDRAVKAQGKSLLPFGSSAALFYFLFYLFIAFAVLTKGPVGIVLPGLVVGAFLVYTGRFWQVWHEMQPLLGGGLIVLLTLPWYGLVTLANGDAFINSFFGYHNVERFTSVVNNHSAPWYFYFVVVAGGFAPWSIFLPIAIAKTRFWQRSIWRNQERSAQLRLFAWFWFAGVFLFFTIAVTKLPSYVVPLVPAAAILVALLWGDGTQPAAKGWGMRVTGLINGLAMIGLAIAIWLMPQFLNDPAMPQLAALLQTSGAVSGGVAIAVLTAIACLVLLLTRQLRWLWLPNLLFCLTLFYVVLMPALQIIDAQRQLPLRQLAQVAVQTQYPSEQVVMVGYKMPSIVFYTRQQILYLPTAKLLSPYLQRLPIKPNSLLLLGTNRALLPSQFKQANLKTARNYRLIRLTKADFDNLPT